MISNAGDRPCHPQYACSHNHLAWTGLASSEQESKTDQTHRLNLERGRWSQRVLSGLRRSQDGWHGTLNLGVGCSDARFLMIGFESAYAKICLLKAQTQMMMGSVGELLSVLTALPASPNTIESWSHAKKEQTARNTSVRLTEDSKDTKGHKSMQSNSQALNR